MISKSIYIAAAEQITGSLTIDIGVMEALKQKHKKIAFYRPIITSKEETDTHIRFMLDQFNIQLNYHEAYSYDLDEVAANLVKYGKDVILEKIFTKIKSLEKEYDFVIVHGYNRVQLAMLMDFDINFEIAKNLNIPMLIVANAKNKCVKLITQEIKAQKAAMARNECKEFGVFVNRIDASIMDDLKEAVKDQANVYLIPDNTKTTDKDVKTAVELFNSSIDLKTFEDKLVIDDASLITTPMMFEYALFERARADKKTIVMDETDDNRILQATDMLLRLNVVDVVLIGDEKVVREKADALGLDISKAKIIDHKTSSYREKFIEDLYDLRKEKGMTHDGAIEAINNKVYFATMMIRDGLADGMVSGATHTTADTVRPALQIIKTKPGINSVSSVFLMCLDTQVLVYGDCAIVQKPSEQELAEIAISASQTARAFGLEPRVAMLSYSTGTSGSGPDVDKVKSATVIAQKLAPDLLVDGPMQYDAATDMSVAKSKAPNSQVAGRANVLVFPDLNSGNIGYKAVQRSSGAIAIGPVLQGLKKPINDLSRGCLVKDIVYTVAITAIQAQGE